MSLMKYMAKKGMKPPVSKTGADKDDTTSTTRALKVNGTDSPDDTKVPMSGKKTSKAKNWFK